MDIIYQRDPVKLYIQDIYRAKATEHKYVYKIFGKSFKNIRIHGVVTEMIHNNSNSMILELSDPTGCAQIHYDTSKCNTRINSSCMNDLTRSFAKASRMSCDDVDTMHFMLDKIEQKYKNPVDFEEGDFLSVLGDIFVENLKDIRIINAYECKKTNVDRDIVWLEELRYVYDKLYIKQGI
ncbi:uncharacterized protein LOC126976201 [Leptidea sinapis]|uniref:uncharacterized protein LOC126976201 n=1 Tax=Leptidea sinapis TaxID=189913 RepID=UPI0021C2CF90|nr:uncharacterized protein LOC126976201 [Leptidea sinapis]